MNQDNQGADSSAQNKMADGHQKKRTLYSAWASVALGVLLLVLWAWFVMTGGFQRWLAPIDVGKTTTEKPAVSDPTQDTVSDKQSPQTAPNQSTPAIKDKNIMGKSKQKEAVPAQGLVKNLERLETGLLRHDQTLKKIQEQLQQTQRQLADLSAAPQPAPSWSADHAMQLLAVTLNQADLSARAGQLDMARQGFAQAEVLLASVNAIDEKDKRQIAAAIANDMQSMDERSVMERRALHKEIDALLTQLIPKPLTTNSEPSNAEQPNPQDNNHYQKTLLWLREQLNRMVTVRHRHFPRLQAEDRAAVVYSLLLARMASGGQEPSAYQSSINNAIAVSKRAEDKTMLDRLQPLAAFEPSSYTAHAVQSFLQAIGQNKQ